VDAVIIGVDPHKASVTIEVLGPAGSVAGDWPVRHGQVRVSSNGLGDELDIHKLLGHRKGVRALLRGRRDKRYMRSRTALPSAGPRR
jgi:hypothetical protein